MIPSHKAFRKSLMKASVRFRAKISCLFSSCQGLLIKEIFNCCLLILLKKSNCSFFRRVPCGSGEIAQLKFNPFEFLHLAIIIG